MDTRGCRFSGRYRRSARHTDRGRDVRDITEELEHVSASLFAHHQPVVSPVDRRLPVVRAQGGAQVTGRCGAETPVVFPPAPFRRAGLKQDHAET